MAKAKARARKQTRVIGNTPRQQATMTVMQDAQTSVAATKRPLSGMTAGSMQALVMAAMVALGCWGFAASFIFFTTTQNHVLYGAMAAVMALMWTVNFGIRLRKVLQRK